MSTVSTRARLPVITANQADIDESYRKEAEIRALPQVRIPIVHSLHGGVYTRTARIPAGTTVAGVTIKPPTTLIAYGDWAVWQEEQWQTFTGFHVIPAAAGRRQVVHAVTDCTITLVFPSRATTVQQAEEEMSHEWHLLQSQDGEQDVTINTHQENCSCQESA